MKKTLALVLTLALALLCTGAIALAEDGTETTIDITFDGSYLEFTDYGFQLYLPNEWVIFENDETTFVVGDEDETQWLTVYIHEVEGSTLDEIAEGVAQTEGIESLQSLTINGISFITYEAPEDDFFGAFANTENNVYCIEFVFSPYDEDYIPLAIQIMASIQAI